MESLIGLVNRIQRACTVLGDHGGEGSSLPTLWEALPSVAVVGGQVGNMDGRWILTSLFTSYSLPPLFSCFFLCFFGVSELGEIFGVGEHCGEGLPPSRIW